jgi:PIN domain nuclease of toxin-antitoxin system
VKSYLLDTVTINRAMQEPNKLSRKALRVCEDPSVERVISVASLWEILVKCSIGAMRIRDVSATLPEWVARLGARVLPLEASHAYAVYSLPLLHRDPFDRMLIAQAKVEDLVIVTNDENIQRYDIKWLW